MNYDDTHRSNRDKLITAHRAVLENTIFLEFGVYRGTSLKMWHELYKKYDLAINFFGFDSFQGLPPETIDKNSFWKEKEFNLGGQVAADLKIDGVKIISGFYSESLTEETANLLRPAKAGLVHMDCDTYSSTKTVWEWLIKYDLLAKNALIVYDDWGAWRQANCGEYDIGEAKAHKEIAETYNMSFGDLGKYIVDPSFYEVKIFQCN